MLRRLAAAVPVLLVASVLVFAAVQATSSPEAVLRTNPRVRPEDVARYREQTGLDRPAAERYLHWLGGFVRGDWGESLVTKRPVWPQVRTALGNTLVLGLTALVLSVLLGAAVGAMSAVRQYSVLDHVSTGAAFVALSIPTFWLALILQIVLGERLAVAGMTSPGARGFDLADRVRHLVLPVSVLAVQLVAVYSRYLRASLLDELSADHLRTARSKGLSERAVLGRHALPNALTPLVTQVALDAGLLAGGLIITEEIFQWPGMGKLFLDAFAAGDDLVVLPWLMVTVGSVVLLNLAADVFYALRDPRVRLA